MCSTVGKSSVAHNFCHTKIRADSQVRKHNMFRGLLPVSFLVFFREGGAAAPLRRWGEKSHQVGPSSVPHRSPGWPATLPWQLSQASSCGKAWTREGGGLLLIEHAAQCTVWRSALFFPPSPPRRLDYCECRPRNRLPRVAGGGNRAPRHTAINRETKTTVTAGRTVR